MSYRMPYTEAVIQETLRYGTIVPIIPRANGKATTLNGCYIPKVRLFNVSLSACFLSWNTEILSRHFIFNTTRRHSCSSTPTDSIMTRKFGETLRPFDLNGS